MAIEVVDAVCSGPSEPRQVVRRYVPRRRRSLSDMVVVPYVVAAAVAVLLWVFWPGARLGPLLILAGYAARHV